VYWAGSRGSESLLALHRPLTLGSKRCVENTLKYFRRFGAMAIVLGRYSTSVRLFAAILSGSGYFAHRRFVLDDLAGSLAYATLWIVVERVFSDEVERVLDWLGHRRGGLLIVPSRSR